MDLLLLVVLILGISFVLRTKAQKQRIAALAHYLRNFDIEKLMERANSIRDIVALESELSNRQAELESLKAQATWLGNQTAMSTISINLQRVGTKSTPNAFVDGLRSGWHSLSASFSALITVLGALIPWLLVVGPVLAIVWWRRRRNGRSAATTAT